MGAETERGAGMAIFTRILVAERQSLRRGSIFGNTRSLLGLKGAARSLPSSAALPQRVRYQPDGPNS
jgi:hypothetical protein